MPFRPSASLAVPGELDGIEAREERKVGSRCPYYLGQDLRFVAISFRCVCLCLSFHFAVCFFLRDIAVHEESSLAAVIERQTKIVAGFDTKLDALREGVQAWLTASGELGRWNQAELHVPHFRRKERLSLQTKVRPGAPNLRGTVRAVAFLVLVLRLVLLTQMDHMLTTTEVPLSSGSCVKSAYALLNAGSVRSSAQSKFRVVGRAGTF